MTLSLPMKITIQSSKLVKPAYAGNGDPPAATDVVPLTVFDKVNFNQYISSVNLFRPPAPPTTVLENGLAGALAVYRQWAGRLGVDAGGRPAILLNDAGARLVEAAADVALSCVLPLDPATPCVLRSLHLSGGDNGAADDDELMLLQVTRFACGSFVVGITAHHLVSDGRAARSFIVAWGNATRGAAIGPVATRRASVFVPRNPPLVQFQHRGVEFKKPRGAGETTTGGGAHRVFSSGDDEVVTRRLQFSREMLSELKSMASEGAPAPRRYSTLKCLMAHLWQCITKARGLHLRIPAAEAATALHLAVDGRSRMRDPPVPEGYSGNVVLWARPAAAAGEVVAMPLRRVVELIGREVSRVDDGYFRSFVDFKSSGAVEEEGLVPAADAAKTVLCPDVEVYCLLGMPVYELDFGAGRPFEYMPSYMPVEGLVFVVPSSSGDGSVVAYVSLFRRAMDIFEKMCYSLPTVDARL